MKSVVWERKIAKRTGQAHVFPEALAGKSVCGTVDRAARADVQWEHVAGGALCASCRRVVDPGNAPKAPRWQR